MPTDSSRESTRSEETSTTERTTATPRPNIKVDVEKEKLVNEQEQNRSAERSQDSNPK